MTNEIHYSAAKPPADAETPEHTGETDTAEPEQTESELDLNPEADPKTDDEEKSE